MKAKEDIRKTLGIYDFKEECESDDTVTEIQIVHIGSDGEIKKIN